MPSWYIHEQAASDSVSARVVVHGGVVVVESMVGRGAMEHPSKAKSSKQEGNTR